MNGIKEITVWDLKNDIDAGVDFQLIDVRESFEYEHSNLDGLHIPLVDVVLKKDMIARDKPVVIHCRSGKRSAQAIQLLQQEGYQNLANLQGGILAWRDQINPELDVY